MEAQPEVAAAAQQEEKADVSSVLLRRLEMGTVDAEQLIKQAFASGDGRLSMLAHQARSSSHSITGPGPSGGYSGDATALAIGDGIAPPTDAAAVVERGHAWREARYSTHVVMGALGGMFTSLSLAAAAAGAGVTRAATIAALGITQTLALSLGIGLARLLLDREAAAYYTRERAREEWETANFGEGEKAEMVGIYMAKGHLSQKDAQSLVETLFRYPRFFVDEMMVWELHLLPPSAGGVGDGDGGRLPLRRGAATALSLFAGGIGPLLPYCGPWGGSKAADLGFSPTDGPFLASLAVAVVLLAGLGCLKGHLLEQPKAHAAASLLLLGIGVVGLSLGVGKGLGAALVL